MSFESLNLAAPLLRAVAAEGYTTPTPIQAAAIPPLVAGKDLLGCAQTGTGKTAAFALPILHRLAGLGNPPKGAGRRIRAVVLAPTRELAAQISESFRNYGKFTALRQVVIYGGVSQHPQVRALQKGVDIVVATPGRLCDLMNQGHVDLRNVECFVLDEADRMLDMGFLPDLRRIMCKLPTERQTLLFSATMPPAIEQLANASLRDPVRVRIAPEKVAADQIEESVCFVSQQQKPQLLVDMLSNSAIARALVFTRTKHGADKVVKNLLRAGVRAEAMHGNKSQAARQRTLIAFKSQHPPIVVATDLAARGIDVTGVSHVFNYDLPDEPETYVHRIGRTGRAGAKGIAIAFCDGGERRNLKGIERLLRRSLRIEKVEGLEPVPASTEESSNRPPRPPRPSQDRGPRGNRPRQGERIHRDRQPHVEGQHARPAQAAGTPAQGQTRPHAAAGHGATGNAATGSGASGNGPAPRYRAKKRRGPKFNSQR